MERKKFLRYLALSPLIPAAMKLNALDNLTDSFEPSEKMPALFIGHGSPMNAIEDNRFTREMKEIGKSLPTPKAILMISAHWETQGSFVTQQQLPPTIHDFGGFPRQLFEVEYPAAGSSWLAEETRKEAQLHHVDLNDQWGFDHGAWSVAINLYPEANIPMIQLSLDVNKKPIEHYELARELTTLREKGVLVIGSGNMVHSFRYAQMDGEDFNASFGHDWAWEANEIFKKKILENDYQALSNYGQLGESVRKAIPTNEHYLPMLYAMAMRDDQEELSFFNDDAIAGSFTMTSFKIGE